MEYDNTQSPYQRGEADCWYGRWARPHKWDSKGRRIEDLTLDEIREYHKGFDDAYDRGDYCQKDYGE